MSLGGVAVPSAAGGKKDMDRQPPGRRAVQSQRQGVHHGAAPLQGRWLRIGDDDLRQGRATDRELAGDVVLSVLCRCPRTSGCVGVVKSKSNTTFPALPPA